MNEDKKIMLGEMAQEENERAYLTMMNDARRKEKMVQSLYEQKFPIEAIEKASGLSKEEILNIVNKD